MKNKLEFSLRRIENVLQNLISFLLPVRFYKISASTGCNAKQITLLFRAGGGSRVRKDSRNLASPGANPGAHVRELRASFGDI